MSDLIETLCLACDDPMWANHVEMPKRLLRHTIDRLVSLQAENERLMKALSEQIDRDISGIFPAERALAERAGGVKVLQAELDWYSQTEHGALDGIPYPHVAHVIRVMLSRLTTEPAALEGRQEAVAWADEETARHWIDRYATGIDAEPQMSRILACITRPAEQAVTEAMRREIIDAFEIEWKVNGLAPLEALSAALSRKEVKP